MLSLQDLSQTFAAHEIAGRFGVELLALLMAPSEDGPYSGVRLYSSSEPLNLATVFAQNALSVVSRAALHDHFLIVACSGEFFATDKLELTQLSANGEEWSSKIEITHFENVNAIPAPRELYLLLSLDVGDRSLRSLELKFIERWRDHKGVEKSLSDSAIQSQTIEFSELTA